ncbi:uracil phosphoribosyltransferase [Actinosynnema sp. ALI-1.44]|uniref:uracil phosphoribosyltransferase n=1 Tax=Actinosynnema sp. ALI-1.44 TaxID=1933779 RepID=UPI00097BF64C|nr:uracil phosphoribosyltransferase [Actinosynnema sp. ALI-1.44]ONI81649.1 uracil phosphoribosyltransferase [Actinosynnema sp. ALI-1.44]
MVNATQSVAHSVHLLPQTKQLRALHTIIRNGQASRDDFVRHASRIIRQLIEAGLEQMPFEPHQVRTPIGHVYDGLRITAPLCGVSVARAGDSMEAELRTILPGIRLGKILIQRDKVTKLPRLYYSALPPDVMNRHVLLFDPMLATGGTALAAIGVLLDAGVPEQHIVFINLLSAPEGVAAVRERHPGVRMVTSSIEERLNENAYMLPGIGDFGDRYFGTDVAPRDELPR